MTRLKTNFTFAIVDAFGVGGVYVSKLKIMGCNCIHIQSTPYVPKVFLSSFSTQEYLCNIIYTGNNLKEIIKKLKKYNTKYVIAGVEPGVELADLLSYKMGLPTTNGVTLSSARRNKFNMIEALKKQGLRTVEHIKSNKLMEILNWVKQLDRWPVVLKQLKSAGNEKVFFCHREQEVVSAFEAIMYSIDVFGNQNKEVLVESYLQGEQYLINVVTCKGCHILSDIWFCEKIVIDNKNVMFDRIRLLPGKFNFKKEIVEYTFKALDALGIKYGPSHSEIMLTKDGPVLIESAARIMGSIDPLFITQALGRSQVELTLDSYLYPQKLPKRNLRTYHLRKHLLFKFIISSQEGEIKKINFLEEIKKLESFKRMDIKVQIGSKLKKTTDLFTSPGVIYLSHENEGVVLQDYQRIILWEKEMFQIL